MTSLGVLRNEARTTNGGQVGQAATRAWLLLLLGCCLSLAVVDSDCTVRRRRPLPRKQPRSLWVPSSCQVRCTVCDSINTRLAATGESFTNEVAAQVSAQVSRGTLHGDTAPLEEEEEDSTLTQGAASARGQLLTERVNKEGGNYTNN